MDSILWQSLTLGEALAVLAAMAALMALSYIAGEQSARKEGGKK